jgi:hypothetical protein
MMPKWVAEQRGQRICEIVTTLRKPRSKPTGAEALQRIFIELPEELAETSAYKRRAPDEVIIVRRNPSKCARESLITFPSC